jgi:meiotic recombination protein SPO11
MADRVDGGDVATILSRLEDQVTAYIQSAACPGTLQLHRLRDAFVASIGHRLLLSGHTSTKRDIYYMNKALFGRQSNADAAVERVAATVPCHRNNLNIVAASKALVAGDLTYVTEQGFEIKVNMFGHSGVLVPPRPERLTQIGTDAEFVLVYVF